MLFAHVKHMRKCSSESKASDSNNNTFSWDRQRGFPASFDSAEGDICLRLSVSVGSCVSVPVNQITDNGKQVLFMATALDLCAHT